jgi:uncharacterized delta-60 repeat protein
LTFTKRTGRNLRITAAGALSVGALTFASPAVAQSGPLDESFGQGGFVSGPSDASLGDLTVHSTSGRIALVGKSTVWMGYNQAQLLGQISPNGDSASYSTVHIRQDVAGRWSEGLFRVRFDGAGRLFGQGSGYRIDPFLSRLRAAGANDGPFGSEGRVPLSGTFAIDGEEIITATAEVSGDSELVRVRRLASDGSLVRERLVFLGEDPADLRDGGGTLTGLEVAPNGAILLGGASTENGETRWAAVRLRPDLRDDPTFGDAGGVSFHGPTAYLVNLVLGPDGTPFLGSVFPDFVAIARLEPDGSLATGFGTNGISSPPLPEGFEAGDRTAYGGLGEFAVDEDGRVVIPGAFRENQAETFERSVAAARLTPDGGLDPGFGDEGVASAMLAGKTAGASEIATHGNRILLAGPRGSCCSYSSLFVARFTEDGGHVEREPGGGVAGDVGASGRGIQVHKLISPRTRAKLAARGILALVSCELDCRALLQVRVSRGAADEMGLSSRVVASGSRRLAAGQKRWVIARLTGQARRALRTYTGGGNFKVNVRGVAP